MMPYCTVLYCTVLYSGCRLKLKWWRIRVLLCITMYYYVSGSDGGFALSICYFQAKARKKQAPWRKAGEGPAMSRKVSCSGVVP